MKYSHHQTKYIGKQVGLRTCQHTCRKDGYSEVGFGGMGWIELAQDMDRWRALVNACGNELSGSIKCGEFLN